MRVLDGRIHEGASTGSHPEDSTTRWSIVAVVIVIHAGACAAIMHGADMLVLTLFIVSWVATLLFGMTIGYHRLLAHRSYQTHPYLRRAFATLGVLACQTGPVSWVAIHRVHHSRADVDGDPHSPTRGLAWAHLLWTFSVPRGLATLEARARRAPDIAGDPYLLWLERRFTLINVLAAAVTFVATWMTSSIQVASSIVLWCFSFRIALSWHLTFFANSIGHRWGYRNYQTRDNSRNVWWLSLLLFGDGWHNNHHAFPRCASHGHRWFELDVTYLVLRALEMARLVRKVSRPPRSKSARSGFVAANVQ